MKGKVPHLGLSAEEHPQVITQKKDEVTQSAARPSLGPTSTTDEASSFPGAGRAPLLVCSEGTQPAGPRGFRDRLGVQKGTPRRARLRGSRKGFLGCRQSSVCVNKGRRHDVLGNC